MKVLLFSNDLMPFGKLPTSGGGLRCFQLMRGLESHGIEVIASMPGFTYLAEKHAADIPSEQKEWLWQWHTQDELLRRAKPDAVLFASNWDHINLTKPFDVPLIVDLHGSRLIETTMWNNPASAEQKVKTFARADCLLCAGRRQRSYFYGWLVQAGRFPVDEHFIRYIPISLSPDLPEHVFPAPGDSESPLLVSGGGWFPWQNQAKAIFAACKQVAERDRGRIRIFGTPHETPTVSAEEKIIRDIYARVKQLSTESERIRVEGYIGRDELIEIYRRGSVAIECMQYNLERELAFTTRTIEYLWCGLPVLYNDYSEVAEHIREYDAGWAINPDSDAAISEALEEIFTSPARLEEKSRNAQRLVRDRFSWDKTIEPLVNFLRNPSKVKKAEPVLGTVVARPSFLSPRGAAVEVPVAAGSSFVQEFVVPAENITHIGVPISLASADARGSIERLEIAVRTADGRSLASRSVAGKDLPSAGDVLVSFPVFRAPKGGIRLRLELRLVVASASASTEPVLFVQGLLQPRFPFITAPGAALFGMSLLGEKIPVKAISLHFIPGSGQIYRVRLLAERAAGMIRRGEWTRLTRAVARRVPVAVSRVKRLVGA